MDLEETEARNDYAGKGWQQFNRPRLAFASECSQREWERERKPAESLVRVKGERPAIVRLLLFSKRRLHFEARKILGKTKILSSVPMGPDTKNNVLARTSSNLLDWTGLDWTELDCSALSVGR
jgi:hypothetical protein